MLQDKRMGSPQKRFHTQLGKTLRIHLKRFDVDVARQREMNMRHRDLTKFYNRQHQTQFLPKSVAHDISMYIATHPSL